MTPSEIAEMLGEQRAEAQRDGRDLAQALWDEHRAVRYIAEAEMQHFLVLHLRPLRDAAIRDHLAAPAYAEAYMDEVAIAALIGWRALRRRARIQWAVVLAVMVLTLVATMASLMRALFGGTP